MKTEKEFAVTSYSQRLEDAFVAECKEIGLSYAVLSLKMGGNRSVHFNPEWSDESGYNMPSKTCIVFDLGTQYSEALAYAKKVMEESKNKDLTYADVAEKLFASSSYYEIRNIINGFTATHHQLDKLLAINKMINVAAYLNPKKEKTDWSIRINQERNVVVNVGCSDMGQVRFASKELAQQVIEILGEDVIRLALS